MNRLIVPLVGLMLGTAALTAVAQDYQRGRDGARSVEDKRAERGERGSNRGESRPEGGRGSNRGEGGRGNGNQSSGPGRQSQPESGRQGRNDNNRGGGQRQGLPNAAQRVRGSDRDQGGRSNRGQDQNRQLQQQYGHNDRQDRRHDRQDQRRDRRDYRQDQRHDRRDNRQDRRYDRRDNRYDNRYSSRDRRHSKRDWSHRDWRRSWNHGWSGNRYRASNRYYRPHGFVSRSWSIGFYLPQAYYAPRYYVDYRDYGLTAPPYGTEWVRADGDLLLVDIYSGEVVDILYDFYY